jgi:hypothetical protein
MGIVPKPDWHVVAQLIERPQSHLTLSCAKTLPCKQGGDIARNADTPSLLAGKGGGVG